MKSRILLGLLMLVGTPLPAAAEASAAVDASALKSDKHVAEAITLLETWLQAERDYRQLPGISAAVVYDQDLIWARGFGLADLESKKPAGPDTIYSICSISKLFTSIGVMQLRDAGKLRLDDDIGQHIPWLKIERTDPRAPAISVEGILTHSSGLPRESNHPYWTGPEFPFPTRDQIIEGIKQQRTLYPASTYYQYSNLGLTLAGELIHQLSGQDFDSYVQQGILQPLKLSSTTPQLPRDEVGQRLASGYGILNRQGERERMPFFQARGIGAAAGFASTVEDLGRFASWQFRLLSQGDEEVLQPNTLREMQRVHWVDEDWSAHRGIGFSVWRSDGKTFVGHGGSCPGFRSHLSLDRAGKTAAVFMSNAMGVNVGNYTRRMHQILGKALIAAAKSGERSAQEPEKDKLDLSPYLGRYGGAWGEAAVLKWKGELVTLYLPSDDPLDSLTRLKHQSDHVFRRIRRDDQLGEEISFEMGADGRAIRMWRHGNSMTRIE